jgi:hypothetical protein
MQWTGEPRECTIDLRGVATREQFQGEWSRHVALPADHRDLWSSIAETIIYQTGPYRFLLLGWHDFEARMPRYARRLSRFLDRYRDVHGPERLAVEYA